MFRHKCCDVGLQAPSRLCRSTRGAARRLGYSEDLDPLGNLYVQRIIELAASADGPIADGLYTPDAPLMPPGGANGALAGKYLAARGYRNDALLTPRMA